jgi:hypothetical protein
MTVRAIEGLCILGLVDLVYRLFLRDLVRAQIGMETRELPQRLAPGT